MEALQLPSVVDSQFRLTKENGPWTVTCPNQLDPDRVLFPFPLDLDENITYLKIHSPFSFVKSAIATFPFSHSKVTWSSVFKVKFVRTEHSLSDSTMALASVFKEKLANTKCFDPENKVSVNVKDKNSFSHF